jgi:hypothetical protein
MLANTLHNVRQRIQNRLAKLETRKNAALGPEFDRAGGFFEALCQFRFGQKFLVSNDGVRLNWCKIIFHFNAFLKNCCPSWGPSALITAQRREKDNESMTAANY